MSAYPIKVSSQSLEHQGGTKVYHLMLIETADNKAVVVNRWGKTGAFGQLKAETFNDVGQAYEAFDKKLREKRSGGYRSNTPQRKEEANDKSELPKAITLAVFNKMGKDAVEHLDPSFHGMREAEPPRVGEDGRLTGADKPRTADVSEQLAAQRREQEAQAARNYEDNPLYGRF